MKICGNLQFLLKLFADSSVLVGKENSIVFFWVHVILVFKEGIHHKKTQRVK